tara:strand:- start:545 stop:982 length:438 start_codon:yes stop_codon:yes gene_type:complete
MTWVTAIASVAAAQQASAAGRYNQAVQERNAKVKEQEAEIIRQRTEYEIAQFDRKFAALQGETKTAVLTSGAELSGSGLRILQYNAEQAEIEKNILDYNSKVAQSQKMEEANFARMRGQIARNEARAAQIGYYAKAGESLLKAYG